MRGLLAPRYGKDLLYVSRTLPVQFATKQGAPFLCEQGRVYPLSTTEDDASCLPMANGCAVM